MTQSTDLKYYADVLARHWKLIAACAILAGAIAIGVSFATTPTYRASVGIAALRTLPRISFTSDYETLSQEEIIGLRTVDITSRRKALAALARNVVIEAKVQEALASQLPDIYQKPGSLLEVIEAELVEGEIIRISVSMASPSLAAQVANLWGAEYEKHVNQLYGERPESVADVQQQVAQAGAEYATAQAELEEFRGNNRIDWLQREISHRKVRLHYQYELVRRLEQLLDQTTMLQQQWAESQDLAETGLADLAMLLLQANAFAYKGEQGLDLSIDTALANITGQDRNSAQYLDAFTSAFQREQQRIVQIIDQQQLVRELLELEQQLEQEHGREQQVLDERNLALKTYQTLNTKLSEAQVAAQSPGSQVRLAMPAIEPRHPIAPRKLLNGMIGGLLGLLCGLAGTVVLELQHAGKEPVKGKQATS